MIENPPSNAGDMDSVPGQIPHAKGQLSLHATRVEKPVNCKEDPVLTNFFYFNFKNFKRSSWNH